MARPIPTMSAKTRSDFLRISCRTRGGYLAEADVSMHAAPCKSFVRLPEAKECDIAVITGVTNPQNIPDDLTERFQVFKRRYEGKMLRIAVYMDIKSFQFRKLQVKRTGERDYIRNMCTAQIEMGDAQVQKCQAIIVTSLLEPGWVALIPRPYLTNNNAKGTDTKIVLGASVTPAIARMCPLPAELAPFIMPISFLGPALDILTSSATDVNTKMYNPFTGFTYGRCVNWQPKLAYFDDVLPPATTEFRLRQQILEAFKARGQTTNLTVQTPHYAPLTSDLKLNHVSGLSIHVEIKVSCVRLNNGRNGTITLEHAASGRADITRSGGFSKGIFTFMQSWDYLFSLPGRDASYALMIRKADWPRSFWHRLPDVQDDWLSHEYPDTDFIDAHKVRLRAGQSALVQDICSIILLDGVPQKGGLTAAEILEFAGPCPPSIISGQDLHQDGIDPQFDGSDSDVVTEDETENEEGEGDESTGAGDASADSSADENAEGRAERGGTFLTKTQDTRVQLSSRREMVRVGQLFAALMSESRHKGLNCPIFLGFNHPEGNIGFVRYKWTEADKRAFDKKDKVPCWIGNLPNETPMITLLPQHAQWRMEYAPTEGTVGELAALQKAGSCLLVCTSPHREFAHQKQNVWLLPSEFVPKVNLGKLKFVEGRYFKLPMMLEGKHSIHKFIVDNTELHAALSEFLSGKDEITIGHGDIQVQPNQYLKTVGAHKIITDVNMDLCFEQKTVLRSLD